MKIFFNKIICILFLSFVFFLTFCNKGFCTEISPAKTPLTQGSVTIVKNDNFSALNYKIIPGDIISVSVYDEPNFLQPEIIVRPDGYATIDPIGEILVEGLNIQDLTRIIEKNFKNFLIFCTHRFNGKANVFKKICVCFNFLAINLSNDSRVVMECSTSPCA